MHVGYLPCMRGVYEGGVVGEGGGVVPEEGAEDGGGGGGVGGGGGEGEGYFVDEAGGESALC